MDEEQFSTDIIIMVDEYWWQVKQANGLLMRLSQNTECFKMLMQVFGCIVLLMVFSPYEGLLCSSVHDKNNIVEDL